MSPESPDDPKTLRRSAVRRPRSPTSRPKSAPRGKITAKNAVFATAQSSTLDADEAVKAMLDVGGDVIKQIRAKAAVAGNSVYVLADIPAPATPTPVVTLGAPNDFKVAINTDGSLTLKWKCASGNKSLLDVTLPAGSAKVMYKIRAVRSTATGPWGILTVMFGFGAAGQAMAALVQPRIAA